MVRVVNHRASRSMTSALGDTRAHGGWGLVALLCGQGGLLLGVVCVATVYVDPLFGLDYSLCRPSFWLS